MSSAMPFVSGDVLSGRYELDRRVAQGGFGKVWRATYLVLARPVAIKLPARRQEQGSSGSPAPLAVRSANAARDRPGTRACREMCRSPQAGKQRRADDRLAKESARWGWLKSSETECRSTRDGQGRATAAPPVTARSRSRLDASGSSARRGRSANSSRIPAGTFAPR